jgi:hypothetical protein
MKFRSLSRHESDNSSLVLGVSPSALAMEHAYHLYGVFQSPYYLDKKGHPAEVSIGFSGTMTPTIVEAQAFIIEGDPYIWVEYRGAGKTVLHRRVANDWFGNKNEVAVTLPLIKDLTAIYKDGMTGYKSAKWKDCTDKFFNDPDSFSYFYDPFYCPELGSEPIAEDVTFELRKLPEPENTALPLSDLRAGNYNGRLVTLYFVHGFDEIPEPPKGGDIMDGIRKDAGYKLYQNLENVLLRDYGFTKVQGLAEFREFLGSEFNNINLIREVSLEHPSQYRFFRTYVRRDRGGRIWVVRSGLFPSDNDGALVTFPTFWKEAWENGDVLYYGGHSGDGSALSIRNMLDNLRNSKLSVTKNIRFNQGKTQIAFFDACSSYAHFQQMYADLKPNNLHILSYALPSLFHTAVATERVLLETVFSAPEDLHWMEFLEEVEKAQLKPHVDFLYRTKAERDEVYQKYLNREIYPSSLLNVHSSGTN